jgi:hypothetical protein
MICEKYKTSHAPEEYRVGGLFCTGSKKDLSYYLLEEAFDVDTCRSQDNVQAVHLKTASGVTLKCPVYLCRACREKRGLT